MHLEVLTDTTALRAFEPTWQNFLHRFPAPTPFQTPEWLLTWWTHFGNGQPRVFIFHSRDEIAGIIPAFLHDWNSRRQLTLIGAGVSDYLEPILDPSHRHTILTALSRHLSQTQEWDLVDWQDLSPTTPLAALGKTAEDTPCTEIELAPAFEAFLQSRPKKLRRNLRHAARLESAVCRSADPELLAALIQLHGARWQALGQTGMIAANGLSAFLYDVAAAMACRDCLRIFSVHVNGRPAAVLLAFCSPTTLFGYLTSFDPAYQDHGLGNAVLAAGLRYAHENGFRRWDFLRGTEPYKFEWGARPIPKRRLTFSTITPYDIP